MNAVKKIREEIGLSQVDLVEKTGLSLRTIQRIETDSYQPKGHTLRKLSEAFGLESKELQRRYLSADQTKQNEKLTVSFINLSILGFFVFPFGNVLFPLLLWNKNRASSTVDKSGREIINFQISWTITMMVLLIAAPFISKSLFPSFPLIFYVLFIAVAVNVLVVCKTAHNLNQDSNSIVYSPIQLL